MGGLLSHGAVVARELGVPCVVDVRDATRRIRPGQTVRVNGGTGLVEVLDPAAHAGDRAARALVAADPADEIFHPLEDHPLARESVYFNVQDPASGLALVASAGVRRGGRAEALLALSLRPGEVLFAVDRADAAGLPARAGGAAPSRSRSPPCGSRSTGGWPRIAGPSRRGRSRCCSRRARSRCGSTCASRRRRPPSTSATACPTTSARRSLRWARTTSSSPAPGRAPSRPTERTLSVAGTGSRDHTWGRRDWSGRRLVAALHHAAGRRRGGARARGQRARAGGGRRVRVARRPRGAHRARPVRAPPRGRRPARARARGRHRRRSSRSASTARSSAA